jgi:multiple sugar transport system permease protein
MQTALDQESYWKRILLKKILTQVVCIILAIICIMPFIIMFMSATKARSELTTSSLSWWPAMTNSFIAGILPSNNLFANPCVNHNEVVSSCNSCHEGNWSVLMNVEMSIFRSFLNSLIISFSATAISVYFSSLTAFGFTAYRFIGNKLLYGFILAVLMVPTQISIVAFMDLMHTFDWVTSWRSFLPLIVPAMAAPSTVFFMRQYMAASLSLELVEAGRIDGCTEFGIFNRLVIPVLMPGMATMAIFTLVGSWNNLFLPTILLNGEWSTIPVYVSQLLGNQFRTELGAVYLGLALTAIPLMVFYLVLSKFIIAGVALGGVKE